MPRIADLTDVGNMGVVLLSCITKRETTKAKTIFCSSAPLCRRQVREAWSFVESGSAAYSNTTAGLHEYFHHASTPRPSLKPPGCYRKEPATRSGASPDSNCTLFATRASPGGRNTWTVDARVLGRTSRYEHHENVHSPVAADSPGRDEEGTRGSE